MKKLVCKLLSFSITFTPVLSFNSNNCFYAVNFFESKARVMTESEFKETCNYVKEEINKYIDFYLGKGLGYEIFDSELENSKKNQCNINPSVKLDNTEDLLIKNFNASEPSAVCCHWVAKLDREYFSKKNIRYTIIKYMANCGENLSHVLFLLCYSPDNDKKNIKYVILDPMAQCSFECHCQYLKYLKRNGLLALKYQNSSDQELFKNVYREILSEYYIKNDDMIDLLDEYKGFLNIPLEKFCEYGRIDLNVNETIYLVDRSKPSDTLLIASDNIDGCRFFFEDLLEYGNSNLCKIVKNRIDEQRPWFEKILESLDNKYKKIQENIVEKWYKLTDKMCLIDLPLDIEFSDNDFMGFGS